MPINAITATGLTVQGTPDIVAVFTAGYTTIYGSDINLDSNTPDGQQINIYATALSDNLQLLMSVNGQFSIPNAYGVQVDNLIALNGMQRQPGTYTVAQVNVVVSAALTLPGQDVLVGNPAATVFTVSDNAGNQYQLKTSHTFGGAGNATLSFVALNIGQVLTSANTITVIVTPLTGVTSANNPSTSSDVIGTNEESDVQCKIRQGASFQLGSTGPADTIRAQLLNTPGVIDAFVPENDTGSIVNTVAANGIKVIVNAPTVPAATIAQVIYTKKTIGCALTASGSPISHAITRPAGNIFTAYWYSAVGLPLFISFTINPINGVDTFNDTAIAAALAAALVYRLNQSAYVGQIITAMQAIAPNAYLTSVLVGLSASPALQTVAPTALVNYFTVSAANIAITP